jgi:hypothetical protein
MVLLGSDGRGLGMCVVGNKEVRSVGNKIGLLLGSEIAWLTGLRD